MDEARIPWIRPQGIEKRTRCEPEQFVIPEPVGRFQPVQRSIRVAEARMDYREGDGRSVPLSKKLIEFAEKTSGFVDSTEPAVEMPHKSE